MKPYSILIVADEEQLTRSLKEGLRDLFTMYAANSGEKALEILRTREIAILLVDLLMPDGCSLEVLKQARQLHPNAIGVLIGEFVESDTLVEAMNLENVRGFVNRHWDIQTLRNQLQVLSQHSQPDQFLQEHTQSLSPVREPESDLPIVADKMIDPADYLRLIPDGFAIVDSSGHILYANPSFLRLLNIPRHQGESGLNLLQIMELADFSTLQGELSTVFDGNYITLEIHQLDDQNRLRYLELTAAPVKMAADQVHAVISLHDLTQRRQNMLHLSALNEVARTINQSLDVYTVIKQALIACMASTTSDGAWLYLLEPGKTVIHLVHAEGFSDSSIIFLKRNPVLPGEGIIGELVNQGGARYFNNVVDQGLFFPEILKQEKIVSMLMVAMRDVRGACSLLIIFSRTPRQYTAEEEKLLTSIANQVNLAVRNIGVYQQLSLQARTDSLTGLMNRRSFIELAEKEYDRARRYQTPLSLLMVDVDDFKRINDRFGHQFGDEILKSAAQLLRKSVRSFDLIGRYGGDEFILLLLECAVPEAQMVIQRINEKRTMTPNGYQEVDFRFSIGLATVTPTDDTHLDELIAEADKAMYLNKPNPSEPK